MSGGRDGGDFNDNWGSFNIPPYPGDDPTVPPGPGFEWRGDGVVGSKEGAWFNPTSKERWHPDLEHPFPIGPHWDYKDQNKNVIRVYKDGRIEVVKIVNFKNRR